MADLGFQFSGESELNESEQCVTNELQHSDASSPGAVKQDSLSLSSSYEPADSNATAPILQATQQINPIDESFVTASVDEHMVKGSDVEPDMSSEDLLQAMAEEPLSGVVSLDELSNDDTLSPLERLYSFAKSDIAIHRIVAVKELPNIIHNLETSDIVEYIVPLIQSLGSDSDEGVRETLAAELDCIILYLYESCPPKFQAAPNSDDNGESHNEQVEASRAQASKESTPNTTSNNSNHISLSSSEASLDEAQQRQQDLELAASTPIPMSMPCAPSSSSVVDSSKLSPSIDDIRSSDNIPPQSFSMIFVDFLLDQNSNLATYCQQCIVNIASHLSFIAKNQEENSSITAEVARALLQTEIFEGIIMNLYKITMGQQPFQARQPSADDQSSNNDIDTNVSSIDEGEMNLAKMMCLSLICALAPILEPDCCTQNCLPIVEKMTNEQVFYVRKEAASAVGSLATVIPQDIVVDKLLPMYFAFSKDSIWHVRRSCALSLPMICGVLPTDLKRHLATQALETYRNDVSRNVRNALWDIIGELISKFLPSDWETSGLPGDVPDPLIDFFLSLGSSEGGSQIYKMEADRTAICAFNFPAVVLTAGADKWDSHLKDTYLSLTKDYQIKVRRSLAYSLHEIARIIGPERAERDLIQIFALYLMDLDEVKQGVLEHMADFLATLAPTSRSEYIPILTEVWDGVFSNWRLRDVLADQLPRIAEFVEADLVVEYILPLTLRACQDEYASVRETGIKCFPVILRIVKQAVETDEQEEIPETEDEDKREALNEMLENRREHNLALLSHVMEKIDGFARWETYRGRIVFAQTCSALIASGISVSDFAAFFLPRLEPLASDPVVNVRIAASRTVRALCMTDGHREDAGNLDSQPLHSVDHLGNPLHRLLFRLALDDDQDVRSFILDFVDIEKLQQEQEKKREAEKLDKAQEQGPVAIVQSTSDSITESKDSKSPDEDTLVVMNEEDYEMEVVGTPMDYSSEEDIYDGGDDETMLDAFEAQEETDMIYDNNMPAKDFEKPSSHLNGSHEMSVKSEPSILLTSQSDEEHFLYRSMTTDSNTIGEQ
ncbi:hypothetical protein VKS41_006283 [Umbelopsis sp. WA50703]